MVLHAMNHGGTSCPLNTSLSTVVGAIDNMNAYHVSGNAVTPSSESEESVADDERGILFMWEEPKPQAKYIISIDPTVGVTSWHRSSRIDGDHKIDNGAIEIFRVDALRMPLFLPKKQPDIDPYTKQQRFIYRDLQVAEYAAPVDAVEIARVANVLGRIYAGDEQDQCELIFESYPGPGMLTLQELLRLGYSNLWHWEYFADNVAEQTNRIGWRSSHESQKVLWYRARRHLMERRVKVMSPWLLNEYANAVIDIEKMRARASYGLHDDRIQAASMAFWAAHRWAYDVERTEEIVTEKPIVDFQQMAPTLGDHRSYKDVWADAIDSW